MKTVLILLVCSASILLAGVAGWDLDAASRGPAASERGADAESGETVKVPYGTVYDWDLRLDVGGPRGMQDTLLGLAEYTAASTGQDTFRIWGAYKMANDQRHILIHYRFFRNYWRWWNPWSWFWGYWPGSLGDTYLGRPERHLYWGKW